MKARRPASRKPAVRQYRRAAAGVRAASARARRAVALIRCARQSHVFIESGRYHDVTRFSDATEGCNVSY